MEQNTILAKALKVLGEKYYVFPVIYWESVRSLRDPMGRALELSQAYLENKPKSYIDRFLFIHLERTNKKLTVILGPGLSQTLSQKFVDQWVDSIEYDLKNTYDENALGMGLFSLSIHLSKSRH